MFRVIALTALTASSLAIAAPAPDNGPPFVPGQLVFTGNIPPNLESKVIKRLPRSGLTIVGVSQGNEKSSVARFKRLGFKTFLNRIARKTEVNDPLLSYQWHFENVQGIQAWSSGNTGVGAKVAVLDTGLTTVGAEDGVVVCGQSYNAINGSSDVDDGDGHGTHVSGTIAQVTNNGKGLAGLAHGSCIVPVKVLGDDGSGTFADIAEGLRWAVDVAGVDVINMSLGINARYGVTSDPLIDPQLYNAHMSEVVVVAASGNDGNRKNVSYPSIYPTVISVGATDFVNAVTRYSNRGLGLDLVAPGGDTGSDRNGDGYGDGVLQETRVNGNWGNYFFNGTSMASPHVAAAAAILIGSGKTYNETVSLLSDSALDLGSSGYDSTYGHGLIQIADALGGVQPPVEPPTITVQEVGCSESTLPVSCEYIVISTQPPETVVWTVDQTEVQSSSLTTLTQQYDGYGDYVVSALATFSGGASDIDTVTTSVLDPNSSSCIDTDGDSYCVNVEPIDCDDTNPDIYPGHQDTKGRWGRDGIDNDCSGVADA